MQNITPQSSLSKLGNLLPLHHYYNWYFISGIGTQMLDHVMDIVEKDGKFNSVVLHVQINNEG